jgi:hypothetical protein
LHTPLEAGARTSLTHQTDYTVLFHEQFLLLLLPLIRGFYDKQLSYVSWLMLCFLANVDCGTTEFVMMLWLLQNALVSLSMGIPIICSLDLNASFISTAIFNVTNSLLSILDSIIFCHFEYHEIGAPFRNIMIPVVDCCEAHSMCRITKHILVPHLEILV